MHACVCVCVCVCVCEKRWQVSVPQQYKAISERSEWKKREGGDEERERERAEGRGESEGGWAERAAQALQTERPVL